MSNQLTSERAAYLAGSIDGEGYIGLHRTTQAREGRANASFAFTIGITNTNLAWLKTLQSWAGGDIPNKPPASLALDALGIEHRVFIHDKPVSSFEEAASHRNQRPGQIVRSILFNIRPDEYLMVLVAGPDQIDWKKLRQIVKRSRVRMATEEEVLEVTGYRVGTVSPFGVKNQARVMLDASVLREEEVSIGSGVRNMAIIMKSEDVHKALGEPEVVDLSESA